MPPLGQREFLEPLPRVARRAALPPPLHPWLQSDAPPGLSEMSYPGRKPDTVEQAMNSKERILSLIQKLADDVSIDEAIEALYLLQKVEVGMQHDIAGDVIDHDEFMRQLEREDLGR